MLELTEHTRIDDYGRCCARRWTAIAATASGSPSTTRAPATPACGTSSRLRPDIIKLDNDLARDIDSDPARRALAGALVTFADEIGAVVVAEGIETQGELEALRALTVPWGQGYHLGRPGPMPAGVTTLQDASAASHSRTRANSSSTRATVGRVPPKPAGSASSS